MEQEHSDVEELRTALGEPEQQPHDDRGQGGPVAQVEAGAAP